MNLNQNEKSRKYESKRFITQTQDSKRFLPGYNKVPSVKNHQYRENTMKNKTK